MSRRVKLSAGQLGESLILASTHDQGCRSLAPNGDSFYITLIKYEYVLYCNVSTHHRVKSFAASFFVQIIFIEKIN